MPSTTGVSQAPSLTTYLKSLKVNSIDTSIELLISLLKRRQIKNSRCCAIATARLLLRLVSLQRWKDAQSLIQRIRDVGRRLVAAQPREMAVGNIVRRILGIVREVAEDDLEGGDAEGGGHQATLGAGVLSQTAPIQAALSPTLDSSDHAIQRPGMPSQAGSLFGIFQQPGFTSSPVATPPLGGSSGTATPLPGKKDAQVEKLDIKAEVIDGIKELLDELEVVDSQIAESALDHVHSNEIILTHTSSQTVQKFLVAAAKKRKFTVFHAEAYPNDHLVTHATIVNGGGSDDDAGSEKWKALTSLGIKVILIPDSAVFALMSRINKVILAPHTVLADGSLIAAAGASVITQAAKEHHVPVVVLSGVYKLSPVYPFDSADLLEQGDPGNAVGFEQGSFVEGVDVVNPLYDHVGADKVDLYVTNLGGCAPSYLYRIVGDHYRAEDVEL